MSIEHSTRLPRPIDPFAPGRPAYRDDLVEVVRTGHPRPRRTLGTVRTEHFDISHDRHHVRVEHQVPLERVHAGLTELLSREIFDPGWLRGADLLERITTGVVVSSLPDPGAAWEHFYRASLREIERSTAPPTLPSGGLHGAIAGYAPVYARAASHVVGDSVVELGSCFGFFSLREAPHRQVTAVDVSEGSVRLLGHVSQRLGTPVATVAADAAHVALPDGSADTVVALHLLEHLEPPHGWRVITEAMRLARRRVVVAVPLELEPEEMWGHVRTLTLHDLADYGERCGMRYRVEEHHGGWLVLDVR